MKDIKTNIKSKELKDIENDKDLIPIESNKINNKKILLTNSSLKEINQSQNLASENEYNEFLPDNLWSFSYKNNTSYNKKIVRLFYLFVYLIYLLHFTFQYPNIYEISFQLNKR